MEKKIIALQHGENEGNDEIGEAKMLYEEDKRAHCIKEEEIGWKVNVQCQIKPCEEGHVSHAEQGKGEHENFFL